MTINYAIEDDRHTVGYRCLNCGEVVIFTEHSRPEDVGVALLDHAFHTCSPVPMQPPDEFDAVDQRYLKIAAVIIFLIFVISVLVSIR